MVDPIIRAKDLTKSFKVLRRRPGFWGGIRTLFSSDYEIVKAVDEVSFAIGPGELVGYIGPNGAGKSTTIKMLTGILYPSGGEVTVDGSIPQRERWRNSKQIGVIFGQRSQLIWDIPPRDSFDLMRKMYAIPLERYRENLATFVELLELRELMERPVRLLSLGQRMRCELVVAMLHDPKILYLDVTRPFAVGMWWPRNASASSSVISTASGAQPPSLTTHDVTDIEQLCRRVMIIDKGHIIYDGNLSALKRQYGRLRRLRFLAAAHRSGGWAGSVASRTVAFGQTGSGRRRRTLRYQFRSAGCSRIGGHPLCGQPLCRYRSVGRGGRS